MLHSATGLQHLEISGTEGLVTKTAVQQLLAALKQLPRLVHLSIEDCGVGLWKATGLAPALQQLTGLTHLQLAHNTLGPAGMVALAPALQQLTGLREL